MTAIQSAITMFKDNTPMRQAAMTVGIGAGLSVVLDGLSRGPTPKPTLGDGISSGIRNGIFCGGLSAAFAGMQHSDWKAAGLNGAKFGAELGVGMAAGNFIAGTMGF